MKLIKEHINFERGQDPLDAMNLGNVTKRNIQKLLQELQDEYGGDIDYNSGVNVGFYYLNKRITIEMIDSSQLYHVQLYVKVRLVGDKDGWKHWASIANHDIKDIKQQIRNWLPRNLLK
jgi:hypothetical protein